VSNLSIINAAYSALESAQSGLTVTSQNVAGASVEGYSRRRTSTIVNVMAPNSRAVTGTTFSVEGFTRFTDALLNKQMLQQRSKSSYTSSLLETVAGLDSLMMDPSNSISEAVSKFFNAAGTLASDASNITNIQNFAATATQVAARVSSFSEVINQLESSTQAKFAAVLEEANTLAPALARINLEVLAGTSMGNTTPSADVLDERDRITMRLQDLLGGSTLMHEDGTASFQVGGVFLVDRQTANKFVNTNTSTSIYNIQIQTNDGLNRVLGPMSTLGGEVALTTGGTTRTQSRTAFVSGQAGAAFEILSNFVPKLKQQLGSFTVALARDVNAISTASGSTITPVFGFKATGSGGGINTAIPSDLSDKWVENGDTHVFTKDSTNGHVLTATEIMRMSDPKSPSYNATIASIVNGSAGHAYDPSLFVSNIPFDTTVSPVLDAKAANSIEALRDSFNQPLTVMTSQVGSTIANWKNLDKANTAVERQLQNRKESISGVNLDEEAANMIKFQQLYGAASKVMQTANQMFMTLLSAMNA
jgi:flagellar hook-associated protein 1 FlgK